MIRKIIQIDETKCNGCGLCAKACHEGAIGMVDGKARLLRDDYCDGLGDCLPACPTEAISFIEREAAAYDAQAVKRHIAERSSSHDAASCSALKPSHSRLTQWPVQIKLAPLKAHYFNGASLLIAADCTAYAYAGFHEEFMKEKVTLIGCPKLDAIDYSEKLTEILQQNDIRNISVVRMEVPCCGGIESAVRRAIHISGKTIPCQIVTLSTEGNLLHISL